MVTHSVAPRRSLRRQMPGAHPTRGAALARSRSPSSRPTHRTPSRDSKSSWNSNSNQRGRSGGADTLTARGRVRIRTPLRDSRPRPDSPLAARFECDRRDDSGEPTLSPPAEGFEFEPHFAIHDRGPRGSNSNPTSRFTTAARAVRIRTTLRVRTRVSRNSHRARQVRIRTGVCRNTLERPGAESRCRCRCRCSAGARCGQRGAGAGAQCGQSGAGAGAQCGQSGAGAGAQCGQSGAASSGAAISGAASSGAASWARAKRALLEPRSLPSLTPRASSEPVARDASRQV